MKRNYLLKKRIFVLLWLAWLCVCSVNQSYDRSFKNLAQLGLGQTMEPNDCLWYNRSKPPIHSTPLHIYYSL